MFSGPELRMKTNLSKCPLIFMLNFQKYLGFRELPLDLAGLLPPTPRQVRSQHRFRMVRTPPQKFRARFPTKIIQILFDNSLRTSLGSGGPATVGPRSLAEVILPI